VIKRDTVSKGRIKIRVQVRAGAVIRIYFSAEP